MKAIWLAILITNITLASSNIIATLNDGTQTEFSAIEILFRGTNTQQISAPIILEPSLTEQKVANKIFISKNVHSNDDYIVNMQNQGASAVIVVTLSNTVAGYMRFRFMDKTKIQQIRIPVFEMVLPDYDDVEPLLLNNSVSTITLLPNDEPNPWDVVLLSPGQYIYLGMLLYESTFKLRNGFKSPKIISNVLLDLTDCIQQF
jgi:hypothetical protein